MYSHSQYEPIPPIPLLQALYASVVALWLYQSLAFRSQWQAICIVFALSHSRISKSCRRIIHVSKNIGTLSLTCCLPAPSNGNCSSLQWDSVIAFTGKWKWEERHFLMWDLVYPDRLQQCPGLISNLSFIIAESKISLSTFAQSPETI